MTTDGHAVALSLAGPRVLVDWYGPQHAELTNEEARTLGYLLRGYARLADIAGTADTAHTADEPAGQQ